MSIKQLFPTIIYSGMIGLYKTIKYSVQLLFYLFSFLFPRDDNIWVYGYSNGQNFTDNSKHMYLYTSNKTDIQSVWITRHQWIAEALQNRGYEAYTFFSLKGMLMTLRSGKLLVTHTRKDVPWWCTGGITAIRLGHGIPFKKYARADSNNQKNLLFYIGSKYSISNYNYSIATSKEYGELVSEATGLPSNDILITGLPRHDMFGTDIPGVDIGVPQDMINEIEQMRENGKSILFYFPTYRSDNKNPIPESLSINDLSNMLKSTKSHLIIRPHINSNLSDGGTNLSKLEQVTILEKGTDFYPVLQHTDLFITDYSSLFYDALYARVPVLFFPYDFDEYTNSRNFFFNYNSLPGEIIKNPGRFIPMLFFILNNYDYYQNKFENTQIDWIESTFKYRDRKNCQRLKQLLEKRD